MWDTLLGGADPYPLRVGDQCFHDKSGSVQMHAFTQDEECCRKCRNQPDFHIVTEDNFKETLESVDVARSSTQLNSNPNGISSVVLKYFHDMPTAEDAAVRGAALIKYAKMFGFDDPSSETALSTAITPGKLAGSGGGGPGSPPVSLGGGDRKEDLDAALKAFLEAAFAKVPGLATPSIMYEQALKRKGTWLGADGQLQFANKTTGASTVDASQRYTATCNDQSQRLNELQDKLIDQLVKLDTEAKVKDADGLCGLSCSEDTEMERMQQMYTEILAKVMKAGQGSVSCDLNTFTGDETLSLLKGKQTQLEAQSFAFLHAECEAVEQCKPHIKVIPEGLIDCSGLYESEILFNDTHMAAIGQYLAGAQRDGQSPGALGHASRLYKSGTIAPGVNPDELWINVCYRVAGTDDDTKPGYVDTMWVRANVCDQRKYETLRAIRKAITEQKRAILALNREILDLQYQVSAGHGFTGPAAFFSTARREGAVDDGLRTQMAIKSSVARAANSMRRNSDRRRKPQLLQTEDGAYGDDGIGGAEDPRFARMMRTLAGKVRGAR